MDFTDVNLKAFKSAVEKMVKCKDVDELFRNATPDEVGFYRSFGLCHFSDLVAIKKKFGTGYLFELDLMAKAAIKHASEEFGDQVEFVVDVVARKFVRMVQFHAHRPALLPDNADANYLWCKMNTGQWNEMANIFLNKKFEIGTAAFMDEFGNVKGVNAQNGCDLIWDLRFFSSQENFSIKDKYETLIIYQTETEPYHMPKLLLPIIQKLISNQQRRKWEIRFIESNFPKFIALERDEEQHKEMALSPLSMIYSDIQSNKGKKYFVLFLSEKHETNTNTN